MKSTAYKKTALLLSALGALSLLSSCSFVNLSAAPKATEKEDTKNERILTHPKQYLTDKVSSFKLGDKEFSLTEDSGSFRNIFGEQYTEWYSKEIAEEERKKLGDDVEYKNMICSHIVQNGVYCADINFYQTDDSGTNVLLVFSTVYDREDKENFHIAHNISYTENGKVKKGDFPYETDKICFSVDGLTTNTATRGRLEEYLGEGHRIVSEEPDARYSMETFAFEDFTLAAYFDMDDIFKAVYIYPAKYNEYMDKYFS